MRTNRKSNTVVRTLAVLLVALAATAIAEDKATNEPAVTPTKQNASSVPAKSADTTQLAVGKFTIAIPRSWQVSTGGEAEQLKAQVKQGMDQMISQYRAESGQDSRTLGIQDFKAARIGNGSGWCVIHAMRIPPVTDYYERMKEDTRQKIEWGMQRGIFEKVLENGVVTIGESKVMKSVFLQKGGSRMVQMAHWSPSDPGLVSQIMILQNSGDAKLTEEVDAAVKSVAVAAAKMK
ncbi:MAG: hypothetical protein V2B20_17160 [Pseudomonadota bacterium]